MATLKSNPIVYTPEKLVVKMLDIAKYTEDNIVGFKILENSFGNGAFLTEIVKRYITEARRLGLNNEEIIIGMESDIHGIEKNEELFNECIHLLNQITEAQGLGKIKWSFMNKDTLSFSSIIRYHYIVGNPPYITYSAQKAVDREYIRSTFRTCREGKADYYYAFIEHSVNQLAVGGKLVYIVPTNMFKTRFGACLRDYIKNDLVEIYDYKSTPLFKDVETSSIILTSSTILHIEKNSDTSSLKYWDMSVKKPKYRIIEKENLNSKWVFDEGKYDFHASLIFSDYFKVFNSIATLLNRAFIISGNVNEHGDEYVLEADILRETVSPRTAKQDICERIIFPYKIKAGIVSGYEEEIFRMEFPLAYEYLNMYRNELNERKSDKKAKWYEYGRSQAIGHMNQPKIMLSTVVTGNVNAVMLNEDVVPYSGLVVTQQGHYPLEVAQKLLSSDLFLEYVQAVGINVSGKSMRISARDINKFRFTEELLNKFI